MTNIFKFPVKQPVDENPYSGELRRVRGLPLADLMDRVFEVNLDFLGLTYGVEAVDTVEFFTDDRYQDKVLADIAGFPAKPEIRGCYFVDLDTYALNKLRDEPIRYFLDNE